MRTESYEILMPEKARVMTEEEMEYEGGFAWWIPSAAVSAVGWVCTGIGYATDNQTLKDVGSVCTGVGILLSGVGAVAGGVELAATGVVNAADVLWSGSIGLLSDACSTIVTMVDNLGGKKKTSKKPMRQASTAGYRNILS